MSSSSCVSVDYIIPKNETSILLNTHTSIPGYIVIQPHTATLSASVGIGSTTGVATCTATMVYDGGIRYLNINNFTFTGNTGSVAACALLTGEDVPSVTQYFPFVSKITATNVLGTVKIDTTGTITFYSDAAATAGWTNAATCTIYARTLKYNV